MPSVLATILFTDLVASTQLLDRLGDERASSLFGEYHRSLDEMIASRGGDVVKWEGDGVMAAFSSAADAVRAAVAIQERAAKTISGEGVSVRVGLSAGEVQGWGGKDYFGTPVVIAKRLCDVAEPGQILCTDVVGGLLTGRRSFRFSPFGPLSLKGLESPVAVLQIDYDRPKPAHVWTEEESQVFRQLARVAVPARAEQLAVLLMLLPFDREEPFRVVELGSGEGALAYAILDHYQGADVLALDGSESMRQHAGTRLSEFAGRITIEDFQLGSDDWLDLASGADAVVTSLVVHHLSDAGKRKLFENVYERLREDGVLLIADVVEAQRPEQTSLFADQYDEIARDQSISLTGSEDTFARFQQDKWNIFRFGLLSEDEYPSPLVDQLLWLRTAGFAVVDCFWLRAGFAVFGGYKTRVGGAHGKKDRTGVMNSVRKALATVEPDRPIS